MGREEGDQMGIAVRGRERGIIAVVRALRGRGVLEVTEEGRGRRGGGGWEREGVGPSLVRGGSRRF